ncbi:hypothetical protein ESCO_003817 [Escovopsis weberi]|uniref:Uncharacterized protein n=1 Tax=Escovopsis weberi TaxID=150374 RepID=A0A0M9VX20_ESCWE|nr:hypothetical protein ESCO_003817 [Escovopsis weberi]
MGKPDARKRRRPVAAGPQEASSSKQPRVLTQALLIARSVILIALLGAFANVSQLTLAPVYGSIPAGAWHPHVLITGCFAGWAGNLALRHLLPVRTAKLLPLVALCVPTAQFFLFRLSGPLGPRLGPLVTEGATLLPLAALTASSVADAAEGVRAPPLLPTFVADAAPGLLSWLVLQQARARSAAHIAAHVGSAFHYTRIGMELCLAGAWALLAPSAYLVLALPALLHTALVNPHVATFTGTAALNGRMRADGWALLARRESVTGYISVAQNTADMARVLRADHSLLGGDWVDYRGPKVTEPVYSVFVMLEAVRLVGRREPLEDADATALVM